MPSLLSISMSLFVFCLFICFWLLDFTYKWNHVVFVFLWLIYHSSVQSLSRVWLFWPHGLQHSRLLCPPPSPEACSYPSSWRWHPTISSSVVPFSSWPQYFPASRSFPMSQLFASGGQSIGVSASASVLPMNIQDLFPLELTGLISLQSKGLSRVFSTATVQKHQFFGTQLSLWFNSHIDTWLLEKPQLWLNRPLSAKYYLCFLICCLGWS